MKMISYDGYIDKLRKEPAPPDFDRLYSGVERKAVFRPRARLALAGALAIILLGFFSYFGFQGRQAANGDMLMSYVFEQDGVDGLLLDYVFEY
jgi:hypothetical protein